MKLQLFQILLVESKDSPEEESRKVQSNRKDRSRNRRGKQQSIGLLIINKSMQLHPLPYLEEVRKSNQ